MINPSIWMVMDYPKLTVNRSINEKKKGFGGKAKWWSVFFVKRKCVNHPFSLSNVSI